MLLLVWLFFLSAFIVVLPVVVRIPGSFPLGALVTHVFVFWYFYGTSLLLRCPQRPSPAQKDHEPLRKQTAALPTDTPYPIPGAGRTPELITLVLSTVPRAARGPRNTGSIHRVAQVPHGSLHPTIVTRTPTVVTRTPTIMAVAATVTPHLLFSPSEVPRRVVTRPYHPPLSSPGVIGIL